MDGWLGGWLGLVRWLGKEVGVGGVERQGSPLTLTQRQPTRVSKVGEAGGKKHRGEKVRTVRARVRRGRRSRADQSAFYRQLPQVAWVGAANRTEDKPWTSCNLGPSWTVQVPGAQFAQVLRWAREGLSAT